MVVVVSGGGGSVVVMVSSGGGSVVVMVVRGGGGSVVVMVSSGDGGEGWWWWWTGICFLDLLFAVYVVSIWVCSWPPLLISLDLPCLMLLTMVNCGEQVRDNQAIEHSSGGDSAHDEDPVFLRLVLRHFFFSHFLCRESRDIRFFHGLLHFFFL